MTTMRLKWLLPVLLALLAGCGFHLRGMGGGGTLPESLSRLRVAVQDSKLTNEPLLVLTKSIIKTDPNAVITDDVSVPLLVLSGERSESQVLSVSSNGRVSGYMLKYEVSFRVIDAKGHELITPQTVRLIRDYTFDPFNVLAKEQEEQELRRTLQRDAVQQIVRRLSRYVPKP